MNNLYPFRFDFEETTTGGSVVNSPSAAITLWSPLRILLVFRTFKHVTENQRAQGVIH